jgi:hypothetical protein
MLNTIAMFIAIFWIYCGLGLCCSGFFIYYAYENLKEKKLGARLVLYGLGFPFTAVWFFFKFLINIPAFVKLALED